MTIVLLAAPGNERVAESLESALNGGTVGTPERPRAAERAMSTLHRFPDGETYVRVEMPLAGREVGVICTLDRPDDKLLPLLFLAATARDLGASRVGLVAPYLAYMRQDRRFMEGEGVTSTYFASLLSRGFDWLVTVDPHLHRRASLAEIYRIPTAVVHAAPRVAAWIRTSVRQPLLIGPDAESAQWVAAVAEAASVPSIVLEKVRRGDRDVTVTVPNVERWRDHTPVLVDDIVSTAKTMIETVRHVRQAGLAPPVCVGVHAVFAPGGYEELREAGAAIVVTCNTISHASNAIDLVPDLAEATVRFLRPAPRAMPPIGDAITKSRETHALNHAALRKIIDEAHALSLEGRLTLLKGLIPSVADDLTPIDFEAFALELRLKGERFYDAKQHPGQGKAKRHVMGERDLEGRES